MSKQSVICVEDLELWRNFIEAGIGDQSTRSVILDSWRRCKELGVDPNDGIGKDTLDQEKLQQFIGHNLKLVEVAKPFMHTVYQKC